MSKSQFLYVFFFFKQKTAFVIFFFFKQKTAYEIGVRLVGSEMCIRDRRRRAAGRELILTGTSEAEEKYLTVQIIFSGN